MCHFRAGLHGCGWTEWRPVHCRRRHVCFRPNMLMRSLISIVLDRLLSEAPAERVMLDRLMQVGGTNR